MWGSQGSKEILCLVPVNRHLALRTLRLRRLESSHCFRLLSSWVRDENSSSGSLDANVRLVSSTYILTSDRRLQFGKSLMYNCEHCQNYFFKSFRRTNVALTRAKRLVILVKWVVSFPGWGNFPCRLRIAEGEKLARGIQIATRQRRAFSRQNIEQQNTLKTLQYFYKLLTCLLKRLKRTTNHVYIILSRKLQRALIPRSIFAAYIYLHNLTIELPVIYNSFMFVYF